MFMHGRIVQQYSAVLYIVKDVRGFRYMASMAFWQGSTVLWSTVQYSRVQADRHRSIVACLYFWKADARHPRARGKKKVQGAGLDLHVIQHSGTI